MKAVPANRYFVFFAIAALGCLADLATKSWAFAKLGMPNPRVEEVSWILNDVFGFQTSLNEGALFGMGQGWVVFFTVLSCVALVALMVWLFVFGAARDRLLTVTLALISGGVLGNLYDRIGMPGLKWNYANSLHEVGEPVYAVRDWILVMIGSYHWPNFNIADSLLVCGAILLAWHAYRYGGPQEEQAES